MGRALVAAVVVLPAALILAGCAERPLPTAPSRPLDVTGLGPSFAAVGGRTIRLDDQCDATFNAVPGVTCTRANGGISFDKFISLLQKTGGAGPWRITPTVLTVREGETLPVTNVGGEVHTYTEVAAFGGGFVPELNEAGNFGPPVPECLVAATNPAEIIPPGVTVQHTFHEAGDELYECCIHPWMRQIVHVRS